MINENNELLKFAKAEDEKYKKINETINKYNLGKYFLETFGKEKNNISNIDDKISIKNENNTNEFISSIDSDNINNIFVNNDNANISYNKTNFSNNSNVHSNKVKINNIPNSISNNVYTNYNYIKKNNKLNGNNDVYINGKKLKKMNSFSKKINNNI